MLGGRYDVLALPAIGDRDEDTVIKDLLTVVEKYRCAVFLLYTAVHAEYIHVCLLHISTYLPTITT